MGKKKGKKLEKKMEGGKPEKPKRLVTLSEESDEASMEKAMKEFEGASDDDKEKMMKEAKKELKEEGLSEEDADKALDMFKKGDKDGLMKMKKEHDAKKGKKPKKEKKEDKELVEMKKE